MDTLLLDLRHTLRALRRQPAYALTVLMTLALGIGAAVAMFTVINAVLLRSLPYPEADRLVGLWYYAPSPAGPTQTRQSEATYLHVRDGNMSFDAVALAEPQAVTLLDEDRPLRIDAAAVTATLFSVLRVAPALGRGFVDDDGRPGAEPVVVLSHAFWTTRFGGDTATVGSTVQIDGRQHRIVGVLPPSTAFPERTTALWVPHVIDEKDPAKLVFFHSGYGRLQTGATLETAYNDVQRLINTIPDVYPEFPRAIVEAGQIEPIIIPLHDQLVGDVRGTLWVLFAAVAVVLLVATANVASLSLVRADARQRELAVRCALGASARRIARLMVTENLVLALVGGAVGLGLAAAALQLVMLNVPVNVPRLEEARPDGVVVAFTALVSVAVALLVAGGAVFRRLTPDAVFSALGAGTRTVGASRGRLRARGALVTAQVALALVLLAAAGLLLRSFVALRQVDPGFDATGVVALRLALPESEYRTADAVGRFHRLALAGIRELTGVRAAAAVSHLPLRDGRVYVNYEAEGRPPNPEEVSPSFLSKVVSDDYFETMGIRLVSGRSLSLQDGDRTDDVPTVVSEVFAERNWPGQDPLGRRFRSEGNQRWFIVVGVVESVRDRSLTEVRQGVVYLPFHDVPIITGLEWREMSLAVRSDQATALLPGIHEVIRRLDPNLPLYDVRSMEQVVSDATARTRFIGLMLAAAAAGALFLGAVGLYGMLAYAVANRRKELGVRLALGAAPSGVRRMVVGQAMGLTLSGVGIGLVAWLGVGRLMRSLAHGVPAADPATLVAVTLLLAAVAFVTASIPARRAARTDPSLALSEE